MSSTNRGAERNKDDFYRTPNWASDIIVPHLRVPAMALEPCAGDGAMMRRFALAWPSAKVHGIEFDTDRAEASGSVHGDFLTTPVPPSYDLIATNPPFLLAQEIVERALSVVKSGGEVAMLLRLAFVESAKRVDFHKKHPSDIYPFATRPSFGKNKKGKKGTDSAAYAWFVWGEDRGNRWFPLIRTDDDVYTVVPVAASKPDPRQASLFGGSR